MSKTNSKALITEIAFKLFLETGYWRTSMSDIMKAASLSKGALYHHFSSKENLYQEVINRYFISYYKGVDWDEIKNMDLAEIEASIQGFYLSFIPEIQALTKKGMSRYFILFFEAYDIYPLFKSEVQNFYSQFKAIL